jgi:class 3 adenylate cyclase
VENAPRSIRRILFPDHPEPIAEGDYRRLERGTALVLPPLVVLNVGTRFVLANNPDIDLGSYDRFLSLNLPTHAAALALLVWALARPRTLAAHRRVTQVATVLVLLTSLYGMWLFGSTVFNLNVGFFVITIAVVRVVLDARLGLFALLAAAGLHAALFACETAGIVRVHAFLRSGPLLDYYAHREYASAYFSWMLAIYVVTWAWSSYASYRFRASEHALRLLNEDLEGRVRDQLEQLTRAQRLRRYLAPQLAEQLLRADVDPARSRERRAITVMFADLRGFTPMVERLEPDVLANVLNRWFEEASTIAFAHGGTIDKFIGDAVMVFFGAPEALGDREQAVRCVRMSLAIQKRVHELGEEFVRLGAAAPLEARIGVASGPATVGSFGATHRSDFTVVGAPVNRAARLEPLAPPGGVLVDERTRDLIAGAFDVRPGAEARLKGFTQPERTFVVDAENPHLG